MSELPFTGSIVVADLETTGIDVNTAGVCQLGAVLMTQGADRTWSVQPLMQTYCRPSVPIEQGAIDVHHITNEMVQDSPSEAMALWQLGLLIEALSAQGPVVLSGYNCTRYDYPIMHRIYPHAGYGRLPQIDVMTLMLRDHCGEKFKLVDAFTRLYVYNTEMEDQAQDFLNRAHDALADCVMTASVLIDWLQKHDNPNPLTVSRHVNTPQLLPCMPFGKHAGKPFKDVPASYLMWAKGAWDDMHPDLEFTMRSIGVL